MEKVPRPMTIETDGVKCFHMPRRKGRLKMEQGSIVYWPLNPDGRRHTFLTLRDGN